MVTDLTSVSTGEATDIPSFATKVEVSEESPLPATLSPETTYVLTSDIESTTVTLESGVAVLDLNGHSITFSGDSGTLLVVEGTLHITGNGSLIGGKGTVVYYDSDTTSGYCGGTILVDGGSLYLHQATVSGGSADYGGGIYVRNGTLEISDGATVSNCTAEYSGGGIYVDNSAFTLIDGTISGNSATAAGGILIDGRTYVEGGEDRSESDYNDLVSMGVESVDSLGSTFTMSGGTVTENTAYSMGGGIGAVGGKAACTMTGGTVSHNGSTFAAGIGILDGTFDMYGGTVILNYAAYGGGIGVDGGVFSLFGGSVTENKATMGGAGAIVSKNYLQKTSTAESWGVRNNSEAPDSILYIGPDEDGTYEGGTISSNKVLNLSGTGGGIRASYGGEVKIAGGSVTGNYAHSGGGVYIEDDSDLTMTGGTIDGNTTDIDSDTDKHTVTYLPGEGATMEINGETYDNTNVYTYQPSSEGCAAMQTPVKEDYTFIGWYYKGVLYTFNTVVDEDITIEAWWVADEVIESDYVKVTYNTNGYGTVAYPTLYVKMNGIALAQFPSYYGADFDGWYLDEATSEGNEYSFNNRVTGELTLYAKWSNIPTGTSLPPEYGGGVYVGGTFTMSGGSISNNTATQYGGGVSVASGGEFTLNGGTVDDNYAYQGGGVYINRNGIMVMTGGKVTDNEGYTGAGVTLQGGTLTMSGGEVIGNTVRSGGTGNGIYFGNGTVNLEGDAAADGIYLDDDRYITITGELTEKAGFVVTLHSDRVVSATNEYSIITSSETSSEYCESSYQYFYYGSEDPTYVASDVDENGNIVFVYNGSEVAHSVVVLDLTNVTKSSGSVVEQVVTGESYEARLEPADGYALPSKVSTLPLEFKDVDLNVVTGILTIKSVSESVTVAVDGVSGYKVTLVFTDATMDVGSETEYATYTSEYELSVPVDTTTSTCELDLSSLIPSFEGLEFLSWRLDGAEYTETITISRDTTLTARWGLTVIASESTLDPESGGESASVPTVYGTSGMTVTYGNVTASVRITEADGTSTLTVTVDGGTGRLYLDFGWILVTVYSVADAANSSSGIIAS
ncbi:MAG: InlB B-repeat-containing protein [Thermoplasmata archaeon]|nr:InlB B-repeat-containing protein [Thermoplasmata archaeon]